MIMMGLLYQLGSGRRNPWIIQLISEWRRGTLDDIWS